MLTLRALSQSPEPNHASRAILGGTRLLIAEDDPISRRLLQATLERWGCHVTITTDGTQAWRPLQEEAGHDLAILDWMMPGMDGVQLCRRIRDENRRKAPYLILLTGRDSKDDIAAGLEAGADDYLTKPFDRKELQARVEVGLRFVRLRRSLAERVQELELALRTVHQLQGLLPICCYCKKIRDSENYWRQVEAYMGAHSDVKFSHGICPECYDRVVAAESV